MTEQTPDDIERDRRAMARVWAQDIAIALDDLRKDTYQFHAPIAPQFDEESKKALRALEYTLLQASDACNALIVTLSFPDTEKE